MKFMKSLETYTDFNSLENLLKKARETIQCSNEKELQNSLKVLAMEGTNSIKPKNFIDDLFDVILLNSCIIILARCRAETGGNFSSH